MSINHFSSPQELVPDATWWTQDRIMDADTHARASSNSKHHKVGSNSWTFHHQDPHSHVWLNSQQSASMLLSPNPTRNFNLTSDHDHDEADNMMSAATGSQELSVDKEPMFEKPLTPSDVGKLNRLVIPKQHAEKYFPLGGDAGDKGLLLGFEDECGKSWRFRYSYWNSSQSYVLTKGWSRYVKEKQLDAGDAVLFERHRTDCERFFIGWRRRNAAAAAKDISATAAQNSGGGAGDEWTRGFYPAQPYLAHHGPPHPAPYQPDCTRAGNGGSHIVPTIVPAGNMKRLRLFGVNLECQTDDSSEPSTPDGSSSLSNHGAHNYNQQQQPHYYYSSQAYSPSDHHNYVQYQTN